MDSEDTAETEPSSEPKSAAGEPENVDGAVGGSEAAAAASTKPASEPRLIPPDLVKRHSGNVRAIVVEFLIHQMF